MNDATLQRTQIYLSAAQQAHLAVMARAARTTSSALIRQAVDQFMANGTAPDAKLARARLAGAWGSQADGAPSLRELRAEERQF